MDYTFYRQIHNNNILKMSVAQLGVVLITVAVVYLVYAEVNENK
jgi:hypothetical protein